MSQKVPGEDPKTIGKRIEDAHTAFLSKQTEMGLRALLRDAPTPEEKEEIARHLMGREGLEARTLLDLAFHLEHHRPTVVKRIHDKYIVGNRDQAKISFLKNKLKDLMGHFSSEDLIAIATNCPKLRTQLERVFLSRVEEPHRLSDPQIQTLSQLFPRLNFVLRTQPNETKPPQ